MMMNSTKQACVSMIWSAAGKHAFGASEPAPCHEGGQLAHGAESITISS